MNLKLEQIPKRSLEITLPDGSELKLTLKPYKLKEVPALELYATELDKQRIKGELDVREYYHKVISMLVEDYDQSILDDLEVEHIHAITEKLQELRQNKSAAEKKSRGA